MAGIVRMLGPSITAVDSGQATTLDNANNVYVSNKTGNAIITVISVEFGTTSLHMHADHDVILQKGKNDTIFSNSSNTHFTKVAHTRG
jgi:hypothetical protein